MKKQKGQTLVEALVALGIAVTIVSAIVVVVLSSLSNSQFSKEQNLANHYAQEGMEVVRRIRNQSWDNFLSLNSTYYCLSSGSITLSQKDLNGCGQNIGVFVREVEIQHDAPSCNEASEVNVIVSWSDGKCTDANDTFCHKVSLVSCFANNNSISAP